MTCTVCGDRFDSPYAPLTTCLDCARRILREAERHDAERTDSKPSKDRTDRMDRRG